MESVPRPDAERLMLYVGRRIARELLADIPGDGGGYTGWRGSLQTAADLTDNDAVVLQIADEIYQAAHQLGTRGAVRAYAAATTLVVPDGPGRWLLQGMLEHIGRVPPL